MKPIADPISISDYWELIREKIVQSKRQGQVVKTTGGVG